MTVYELRARAGKGLVYLVLLLSSALMAAPFFFMISTALKAPHELNTIPPVWIPAEPQWRNFIDVWKVLPFGRYFLNTSLTSGLVTLGVLLTSSMGAYAFSRLEWKARDKVFLLTLATMMLPFAILLIPLYQMMKLLGWIDSYAALIVPWIFSPYGTFLLRQFFMTIPKSLEDAATIDGASRMRILFGIILPLSVPALVTLGTFTFLSAWNSFLWPMVVTTSQEKLVLSVGLSMLTGTYSTKMPLVMAAVTVTVLPTIALFVAGQKWFIQGIAATGIKG